MNRLPASFRASFRTLLAAHGLHEHEATVALKIRWLLTMLEQRGEIGWKTFTFYARHLAAIGPTDEAQRHEDALILAGFVEHMRHNRVFRPERRHWGMPEHTFRRLVATYKGDTKERGLTRSRTRTQLKLAWSSGVRISELLTMRRHWLEPQKDGYRLTIHSERPWARRTIPIYRHPDSALCAVRELDRWLDRIPPNPDFPLFPLTNGRGDYVPDAFFGRDSFRGVVQFRLRQIGHPEYDYTSIRISFLKRCRDKLGEAAAFYLSGSKEFKSFRTLMSAEATFVSLPLGPDEIGP